MSKSGILQGMPWHVEKMTREEGDDRRHKSKCIKYRKGTSHCSVYNEKCRGSAHCPYYEEKRIPTEEKTSQKATVPYEDIVVETDLQKLFPISSKVLHKTYGVGTVKKINGRNIVIVFEKKKVGEKELNVDVCLKNNILRRK